MCLAGKYQSQEGQLTCDACINGKYLINGTAQALDTAIFQCTDCATGKHYASTGASCSNCASSYAEPNEGSVGCDLCLAGKYQSQEGQLTCDACGNGKYLIDGTAQLFNTASSQCTDCTTGKCHATTGASCSNCVAGKYHDTLGALSCKLCGAGEYQADNGQSACTACANGKYLTAGVAGGTLNTAISQCTNCQAGKYYYYSGASCLKCKKGQYSAAAGQNIACSTCVAGEFQDQQEQTSCKACPNGQYIPRRSSDASNDAEADCTRTARRVCG